MKPSPTPAARTGGQLIVDQLLTHGAELAFCVPGESYLPVLDALYAVRDRIRLITCRHENGAANMAEAYGKLTGKPGICLVTRGPGATNASIGVHTAFQDSTPMILLIGQVGTDFMEREAFQEIDYRRMFGPMSKWVAQIDRTDRIPEFIARAYQVATSGRMGPVVLALPEDVLSGTAQVADARPWQRVESAPSPEAIARLSQMLGEAQRPFLLAGGSGWNEAACAQLQRFAETQQIPVGCEFRSQDLFDNAHPNYAGDVGIGINPKLAERIKASDLLIVLGARLGEITTSGYGLIAGPVPAQRLVHIYPEAEELGRFYHADLMINATMPAMSSALAVLPKLTRVDVQTQASAANQDYRAWQERKQIPGKVQMWDVIQHLDRVLPPDVIVTNGAGNYTTWAHRFHRYRGFRTQLAPTSGAMGYGVPAGIAAKALYPDRTVISLAGDGCFLMTGQELATAVQYQLNVIIIVVNNNMYGTIRMHQEREYPARVHGTSLVNPDFAAYATAFGAHGELVETTEQFAPALDRALAAGKPALIEIRIDPEAITPNATLQSIREAARQGAR
ncbi:thiamine pyrophosphate-binding protein [Steroidobacter sp. S1-65]|uniref:Thiamine pyrophosphate-binding protein n=1 Tax=Steroidobacter gossypii TaxID=2805490 RepID=A0ABS1X281_9GAMM|nr:thiamine pyrophosphate-binding protein [Steroidobacter gossypii]MBM0107342.1 thiamine pyrophosphate-binding protein [Steroidobacter gossypii]